MGIEVPDGGLGASQAALKALASYPISDPGKPLDNVTDKENTDKISTTPVTIPAYQQHLNSPSHLRITINTEDKKIEIEQVNVTLVYKGHGCNHLESTMGEESSATCDIDKRNLTHCESHPQVTEFNVKNVTIERNEDGITEELPETKETDNENVKAIEITDAAVVSKVLDEKQVDKDRKEEKQYEDAVDTKEYDADGTKENPMTESEYLTKKDVNENDENLEEISSLDEINLPIEEDKELFRAPSLLLVLDYRSDEWKVREFGEIIILYRPEKNYQLQFRRYQHNGFETSLAMTLRETFKLHQMRYSHNQAWEWTFHYITERGTGVFQTLAAKFLTRDIAYEFYNKIKECVLMLKNRIDVLAVNSEDSFLAPSQSIRLISRSSTPTFGPALPIWGSPSTDAVKSTVLQTQSADKRERSVSCSGYWTTPISSKSRKIARRASNTETGLNNEEYQLKGPRYSETPPLFNVEKNPTEESKVSLVYKCHACGLCFDRPEILLSRHLNNCSPTTKLVKTKCTCGLIFDQHNFNYHCEVHRKYTALNVKKVVVREERDLDVSGMRKVFMEDEMRADEALEEALNGNKATLGRSVKNDENNMEDKLENQSPTAMNKCVMGAKVADEKAANVLAVRTKAHRVYVCQCRLCFDRAEFFIKHLKKCSLDAKVVKTTCVCDLVYDKHNFGYHCEVHRQVAMLNVKYIVVRDEGILDVSGMVQEFIEEEEEIKVTETTKVSLEKTVDQIYLVENPVPKNTTEENGAEGNIGKYEIISSAVENSDTASEDKVNYITELIAEKAVENPTTTLENNDTTEDIIGFVENKIDESQELSCNASKEVVMLNESINGEKSKIRNNSDACDKLINENDDINGEKDLDLDKSNIYITVDNTILAAEEKQQCVSDTNVIDSDDKNSYVDGEVLVQNENHVEENIINESKTEEKTVHNQTVITVVHTVDHGVDTEENDVKNDQEINRIIKNNNENNGIKEMGEENKTDKDQEAFYIATTEINVTNQTNNEEVCTLPNNSEPHGKIINGSDRINNGKDPDSVKLMTDETIAILSIEEKQQCYSGNDPIDIDKKTDDTVKQILVKDENYDEKNITIENKKKETLADHQTETEANEIEYGVEIKENETLKPQNTECIKETIQIPDGKDKNENQNEDRENAMGESQKALINATREINVTIESCNVEKSELPYLESNGETTTSDINNQKDPNLLESMTDKKNNDNISSIKEKHQSISDTGAVVSDENKFKKESQASNTTNSNQRKPTKQGSRNVNSTSNDSKRVQRGGKRNRK